MVGRGKPNDVDRAVAKHSPAAAHSQARGWVDCPGVALVFGTPFAIKCRGQFETAPTGVPSIAGVIPYDEMPRASTADTF